MTMLRRELLAVVLLMALEAVLVLLMALVTVLETVLETLLVTLLVTVASRASMAESVAAHVDVLPAVDVLPLPLLLLVCRSVCALSCSIVFLKSSVS